MNYKELIKNIGCYIIIPVIILYFICIIIFISYDYKKLETKIYYIVYAKSNFARLKNIVDKSNKITKSNYYKVRSNLLRNNNSKINQKLISQNKKILGQKSVNTKNLHLKKISVNTIGGVNSNRAAFLSINKNKNKNKNIKASKTIKTKNIKGRFNIKKMNDIEKKEFCQRILNFNNYEKNNFSYQEALRNDTRSYVLYYFSLIKTNHLLFFSFVLNTDYNSRILKIYSFFFIMSMNLTINALFFDDSTMHVIYLEKGKFDIIYQIPKIAYSTLISAFLSSAFKYLSLTEKTIIAFKKEKKISIMKQKENKILKNIKRNVIIFFVFSFFLLLFFWYYITCFCAVYKNTQIHLIKNFVISFCSSMIYPFFIYIIPVIFRVNSLKNNKRKYMYNFSKLLQSL